MGPRAGPDSYGISRPHRYWIPGTCSPWRSRYIGYAIPIHSFGLPYGRFKIKFLPHGEQMRGHYKCQSELCLEEITAFIVRFLRRSTRNTIVLEGQTWRYVQ